MAGPFQKAVSDVMNTVSATAIAGKKLGEKEVEEAKATAKLQAETEEEAKATAMEADLIKMGADPESAKSFMIARSLGLDTSQFGMIRKKGKFVGKYSTLAEKLSKDALTDTLSSRVINEKGFAGRIMALGGTRKGRVEALIKASEGGKK